jgi:hypothetical protein
MGNIPGQSLHERPRAATVVQEGPRTGSTPTPWQFRPRAPVVAGPSAGLLSQMDGAALPMGIERRLPRRAEQLWNQLRGEAEMPAAEAAAALLAPPFSTQALLVTRPVRGRPQIAFAGGDISWLGPADIGPATGDSRPTAPIPQRLVALSLAAIATGAPRHLDSDFDPDTTGPSPGVLFRAVALPLSADRASGLGGLAVAVLSWRKLLSKDETDALHSELQAAISWLGSTGPEGSKR